jgi:hypothetical protein
MNVDDAAEGDHSRLLDAGIAIALAILVGLGSFHGQGRVLSVP